MDIWALVPFNLCEHAPMGKWLRDNSELHGIIQFWKMFLVSVLRVWDVILFQGNRVMLFRTALALMDLYGPALGTTRDAGDAITLLQTLTGSTFDSSQLVMTACMGFLSITEDRLNELRAKHRPAVLASIEERAKGSQVFKDPKGLATKLYSFKHDPSRSIVKESRTDSGSADKVDVDGRSGLPSHSANLDEYLQGITIDSEVDSLPDLQEQVVWLKVELCRLLEEKRSAVLRAEELEAAFMEMVQEDNRRELSARVEQLEQEVVDLQQALADKKVAEQAMVQVLMKVEQEQRITENARQSAEKEAAVQRHALQVLEGKYQAAMAALADMEKRTVMAESMLEATIQYESGQGKVTLSSPRSNADDASKKSGIFSLSNLGWRDKNKGKSNNDGDSKPQIEASDKTRITEGADADSSNHPK
ncbi:uncharacterized protein LOC127248528 isoform X2 [Andrographis paniculata]|uniref:uncharacterized protein LOC127248528 isoform X2 n=1 Tax=Andrographis paniculata TaxID=175694 RepID=UPI0021E7106C|nr:uncharacterized protein LOC127248528 isoform X2 [Andrographis paniculata]XP_051126851.1 uncharacterized protein LOC127248528 isoform X2 [Andrographis paniculata]